MELFYDCKAGVVSGELPDSGRGGEAGALTRQVGTGTQIRSDILLLRPYCGPSLSPLIV